MDLGGGRRRASVTARIVVTPLASLAEVVEAYAPKRLVTMMSRPAEVERPATIAPEDHLYLTFNDIEAPREGLVPPGDHHVDALLRHVAKWDRRAPLVLQCWFGVSRSTAAGLIALMALSRDASPEDLARRLREAAPFATPNRLMIAIADRKLDARGRLIDAVSGIGRGAEVSTGSPFVLNLRE